MPGVWTQSTVDNIDSARPGLYTNFRDVADQAISSGLGTVGIIAPSHWGPINEILTINSIQEGYDAFYTNESGNAVGATPGSQLPSLIRFAFQGGADRVKAYRIFNGTIGNVATLDLESGGTDTIALAALYPGTVGGNFSIVVDNVPGLSPARRRVRLYIYGDAATNGHAQAPNAGTDQNLVDAINTEYGQWISATLTVVDTDPLDAVATASLVNPANPNGALATSADFNSALDDFERNDIDIITTNTDINSVRIVVAGWVTRQREAGNYIMGVVGAELGESQSATLNNVNNIDFNQNEAMVYVTPGVNLLSAINERTTYEGSMVAAFVAGIISNASAGGSITYTGISGASRVEQLFTNSEIIEMIGSGITVLTPTPGGRPPLVRIERGVTTLTDLTNGGIASFRKIRIVRILDSILQSITRTLETVYIGREINDVDGRQNIIDAISSFLDSQVESRNIEPGFSVTLDETRNNSGDSIFLNIGMQPTDSVEFVFTQIQL